MDEINEVWYTFMDWDNTTVETQDKKSVRFALKEGRDVTKTTRKAFQSGASHIYLTVITDIKKLKDI